MLDTQSAKRMEPCPVSGTTTARASVDSRIASAPHFHEVFWSQVPPMASVGTSDAKGSWKPSRGWGPNIAQVPEIASTTPRHAVVDCGTACSTAGSRRSASGP